MYNEETKGERRLIILILIILLILLLGIVSCTNGALSWLKKPILVSFSLQKTNIMLLFIYINLTMKKYLFILIVIRKLVVDEN